MVTTVYLVRHAEAMGNINETFQGHTDCDLSPKGEKQLDCLKERFRDIQFDRIYSSPLIRARRTAEAADFYHNLPVETEENLIEINGGVFEGKKWSELPVLYPKEYDLWEHHQSEFNVENGESMVHVYERMKETVCRLAYENLGKTIVLVSHGCAIKNFLCYANALPHDKMGTLPWSDNTAVSKLEIDADGRLRIIFQNDSSHLTPELSTLAHQTWWRREETTQESAR